MPRFKPQSESDRTLRCLVQKVREKGVIWCIRKGAITFFNDTLIRRVAWIFPALRFLLRPHTESEKRILAICDFRVMPWTVGELLYFQEMTLMLRLEHNVDKVDTVWLCDPNNPARRDQGITAENYHYYLSVLLPLAYVNPHLGSFMLMDSPEALKSYVIDNLHRYYVFPPAKEVLGLQRAYTGYFNRALNFYAHHGFIPHLSCKPAMNMWAHSFLQQEIRPYLPIVVHLRNRADSVARNSKLDCWLEFFKFCRDRFNVKFIVIGTREESDPRVRSLQNVIFSKDYGTTVEQDCALIQTSLMYMGGSSGVMVMAIFSNVPYIWFNPRPIHENIVHGSQLPFATSLQRLVWKPETTESIIDEFTDIFGQIDISQWEQEFDKLSLDSGSPN